MKKTTLLLMILLLGSASLFAQTTAQLTRFEGQQITGLKAGNMFKVELRQGEKTGVQIELGEELLPHLVCSLDNGILRVGLNKSADKNFFNGKKNLTVKATVTLSRLDYLSVEDMSSVSSEGVFTSEGSVEITVSDMSKLKQLELHAEQVSVRCSDMSKITGTTLRARGGVSLNVSDMSSISDLNVHASTISARVSDMSRASVTGEVNSVGQMSSSDMSSLHYSSLVVNNK